MLEPGSWRYAEGFVPVARLKILLNVDFDRKPESRAMARTVKCARAGSLSRRLASSTR